MVFDGENPAVFCATHPQYDPYWKSVNGSSISFKAGALRRSVLSDLQTSSSMGKNPQRWYQPACEIIITGSFFFFFSSVLSHGVKDNERQRRDRGGIGGRERKKKKTGEGESRALETEGESLNLSSSLWVQDERRIDGWIIGTKPQRASLRLLSWKLPDFLSAKEKKINK